MHYRVEISPSAQRDLRKLRKHPVFGRLESAIKALAGDPRPPGCLAIAGERRRADGGRLHRIRVGDYRVLYDIFDRKLLVVVVRTRDRKGAY